MWSASSGVTETNGPTPMKNSTQLKCLVAWIGRQDLDGAWHDTPTGPIVDFLRVHPAVTAVLMGSLRPGTPASPQPYAVTGKVKVSRAWRATLPTPRREFGVS